MTRGESKDLLSRLADAGEEAIHKLSEAPGAERLFGALTSTRDRVDELQRRVRGLEGIDRRVVDLEQRVAKLEGGAKSPAKASTPAKRASTRTRKTTSTSSTSSARSSSARRGSGPSKSDS